RPESAASGADARGIGRRPQGPCEGLGRLGHPVQARVLGRGDVGRKSAEAGQEFGWAPLQFLVRHSRASGNPAISAACPGPPLSRGRRITGLRAFLPSLAASSAAIDQLRNTLACPSGGLPPERPPWRAVARGYPPYLLTLASLGARQQAFSVLRTQDLKPH